MNNFEEAIEDGGQVNHPIFWSVSILRNDVLKPVITGKEPKMSYKNYIKDEYDIIYFYKCRIKVSYFVNCSDKLPRKVIQHLTEEQSIKYSLD